MRSLSTYVKSLIDPMDPRIPEEAIELPRLGSGHSESFAAALHLPSQLADRHNPDLLAAVLQNGNRALCKTLNTFWAGGTLLRSLAN